MNDGHICPCCGQLVKTYKRSLNCSMALVLIYMNRFNKMDFFHVEDWLKGIGKPELRADFHKLRFWGLLEAKVATREDGSKRNGYYKITGRGIAFSEGKLTVPEKAIIYNNKFQGFEGEEIDIRKALGKKFNFDELMGKFSPRTTKEQKELTLFQ